MGCCNRCKCTGSSSVVSKHQQDEYLNRSENSWSSSTDGDSKELQNHFLRTDKEYLDDELLYKKIMKLNFGIYPCKDDENKLIFRAFIYVEYVNDKYNLILQVGSFDEKDKNNDVSYKAHVWGKNNRPGIEFMEKDANSFYKEFLILIRHIQPSKGKLTHYDLLLKFPLVEDRKLTLYNILDKVDPNKDKYLLTKILEGKTTCLKFCIDVIKKLKEDGYIEIDQKDASRYFNKVIDITERFKQQIKNDGSFNKDVNDFCSILGI